jgi:hypothetical protein
MVNPGGKSTMLGHWRIALRQAEESARAGRLDEAIALVSRPDVADHRLALRLRSRLALELVGRAARRAEADDTAGALGDLELAEKSGAPPDTLAAARLRLAEQVSAEVRDHLDAGEPARVVERVAELAKHRVSGPVLRRLHEAADAWQKALAEARRGEFGLANDALDRAERLAGEAAAAALAAARRDLEARQKAAGPKVERLYAALAVGKWGETLAAAEALLETLPDHPAARQARARAWQQIGAISPAATLPGRGTRAATADDPTEPDAAILRIGPSPADAANGIVFLEARDRSASAPPRRADAALRPAAPPRPAPASPPPAHARRPSPFQSPYAHALRPAPAAPTPHRAENPGPGGRFLLWADSIGGYLVCLEDEVVLGRAGPDGQADIPLLGDLSRRHASLVRDGDSYILKAHHPCFVNGRRVESAPLRNGDVIRLGSSVELEFRQPSPVSATARLAILSRHRLPVAVDGVVLMAETCILGPSAQAHVPAPNLEAPVVLYRQGAALWCRAAGEFEVDGRSCLARAALTLNSSVLGEGFSFSLEPLGPRSTVV